MIAVLACTLALLLAASSGASVDATTHDALRTELLQMAEADRQARRDWQADLAARERVDRHNTERLKQIVDVHGWPSVSVVGKDGAAAAWLLAQHASMDRDFQREVLARMESLVATREVEPAHYAYLWDQLHDPQRYGTQGTCVSTTGFVPRPIESPASVDQRRASVGLGPLAEYLERASSLCVTQRYSD